MTRETITLTKEEQRRLMVLTKVREGHLLPSQAAQVLALSLRHCRRLLAAFRREGAAGLAHGNRGQVPHNRLPNALRRQVVRLAKTRYVGFNHQHLTEHLVEHHGLPVSRPTVSRWLLAAGLPSPRPRRRRRFRRRRERMPQPGLLLQWDGSQHDWLEGRGPRLVLQGGIDDATNDVPTAIFREHEDAYGYLVVLRDTIRVRGIPVAIYGDRHGIFTQDTTRALTLQEQLRGLPRPLTQVGRALADLNIRWIPAHSPQAKGRIERLWGTFQDRLVSELRYAKARTLQEANAVLQVFLPRYNARFTRPAAQAGSAYRPVSPAVDLDDICCFKYERTVANDNTVQVGALRLQLLPGPRRRSYAKARAVVHEHLDGTLSVHAQGERLACTVLTAPSPSPTPAVLRVRGPARLGPSPPVARTPRKARRQRAVRPITRPTPDHPWRRHAAEAMRRKLLREAGVTFSLFT